ncbi:hybrid sensor histidine kinase/response regulator [Gymnodinialimonas ulvae]|uniref:hybrid sensor histidine kinase/response regulator n=1 Tax=Gymnodinialimonas ulvae TaxID=3126504 RepID=UPI003098A84D
MSISKGEAEEVLSKITDVVPGIIYVFNQKTQSNEYSNAVLGEVLGYSGAELGAMGQAFFPRVCHPDDLPEIAKYFAAIQELDDGDVVSIEYRMRHKAGHWVWLLSNDTVFDRDTDGEVWRHIGVATDISAQKRSEAAIAAARDELETIFNAASSGIIALNAEGQIVRINERARALLGGVTRPVPMVWPEGARFIDYETMQPLLASADPLKRALLGHDLRGETHLMRALSETEEARYVRVSNARPKHDLPGIHTVLVLDDVSNEERNRQVIERKGRLDALGQLTGGIAHDFNNLLAALLYSVELAARSDDPQERATYLETAQQSIQNGAALTARLLAFARRQPGRASVKSTQEVFDAFARLVRPMLEAHFEIDLAVSDPDLRHLCDQAQLETALMNLVLNARDAMLRSGKGNRIRIRARAVRSTDQDLEDRQDQTSAESGARFRYVEISVADNGPGMDEETLARSTDPFFTTKQSNSGTGLGLAIVYGFIRQADGDLRIYSEEGVGTTVQMTLPRGTSQGAREAAVPPEDIPAGTGELILLVEDEYMLLSTMTDVLEGLGYGVIGATSGQEALAIAEGGERFDLLMTDVVMPGAFGGFELARRVRERFAQMPVIYMSGYTGFTLQEMGEVQAPLLQKPTAPTELAQAVAAALAGARAAG